MNRADRKIKCCVCGFSIMPGEEISWADVRWHGVARRMPMHIRHDTAAQRERAAYEEIVRYLIERSIRDRVSTFTFAEVRALPMDESDSWII